MLTTELFDFSVLIRLVNEYREKLQRIPIEEAAKSLSRLSGQTVTVEDLLCHRG